MKFAEIIRNAGVNVCPGRFAKTSSIEINLYDGKDRKVSGETVTYIEPIFKNNRDSYINFYTFLTGLEEENIESMNVKVDVDSVILFYKTPREIVFLRNPSSIQPIGCVE